MNQYEGTASDGRVISIPDDTDVADSESVDSAFRSLKDSSRLTLSVHSENPVHQRVRMHCTDTSTVITQPVGGYMQQVQPFIPYSYTRGYRAADIFTASDLDPLPSPVVFEPDLIYYCYIVWDPAIPGFKRRITRNIPDETLSVQKSDPNFSHYIGAFVTDSGRRVFQYNKAAAFYTFEDQPELLTANDTVPTTFDLTPIIPFYCSRVRLRLDLANYKANDLDVCRISAGGPEQNISMAKDSQSTNVIDLVLRTKIVSVRLLLGLGVANLNQAVVSLDGMWES